MTMVEAGATQINPIVLVAGGTGGHVFPAEALAGALRAQGDTLGLLTDNRGGARTGAVGDVPTPPLRARPGIGRAAGRGRV